MNGRRVRDGDAQEPEPKCLASTGELIDIERVTISSERGRWKSTREGNSLTAYSTSSPVLEQRGAGRLTHRLSQIERRGLPTTRNRALSLTTATGTPTLFP